MPFVPIQHDVDPRQKLIDEVGDISGQKIFNNQILVAVYVRPEKTKSGLYLTSQTTDEDKYQGKVGVIVGMGPSVGNDNSGEWFDGHKFSVGDWVVFRPSDGWSLMVNGVLCRMLADVSVKMAVDGPDVVY